MSSSYLIDIIVLLLATVVAIPLSYALRLGAVPGYLIIGLIIGPYGLGLISNVNEIGHLSEIGVVFLLFVIGIELKVSRLKQMRRLVFGLGLIQVVITGLVIGVICHFIFNIPVRIAVFLGPTLALSSTAFVLQILSEQKLLTSLYGRTAFSILLFQDLAIVPMLALVQLMAFPELKFGAEVGLALLEALIILGLVIITGRYLLNHLLHRVALSNSPEVFTASAILLVLGTALATDYAGLSMAMGAFMAGLLISDSSYRHQVLAEIQPFRGLLLGLFFISMGMSINLNLFLESPLYSMGLVGLLVAVKGLLLFPLSNLFGVKKKNSLAIALVLAQSGEFALVIFSLAFQSSILNQELYQQLLLIVLMSMLVTPLLAHLARRVVKGQDESPVEAIPEPTEAVPVVIAGFGRAGQLVGEVLAKAELPYVALDVDAKVVEKARLAGLPVFFGDVRKPEVLKAAGAGNARIIIVSLNDPDATELVVKSLGKIYPGKEIMARGHSHEQCIELRKQGASCVISEVVEASLELSRVTLMQAGIDKTNRDSIISEIHHKYQPGNDS